jgi:TRAP-type C4-dicarboxylate transport system substrate-binding protein
MRQKIMVWLLGLLLVSAIPLHADENPVLLKIGTLAPEGSSWTKALDALNDEVMQKTAGKVRFRIYAGGVLGDEKDMLRKLYIGQIQGAVLTSSGLSALFEETDVFQIPFLFNRYDEVDYVVDKMTPFFEKGFDDRGYVLLGWSEGGFVYLMSTNPIATLADLKANKVWVWADSPMARAIFEEAHVPAIPLSVPDVLVGLQTGMVDVVYAPPSGAISLQWFTKVKFVTDVPLIYLLGGLVVKKSAFQQISPPLQKIVKESFQTHMATLKQQVRKENQEAIEVMQTHGIKVIKPSPDQTEEFKKLSDRAVLHLGGHTFSPDVLKQVKAYLDDFRKRQQ